MIAFLLETVVGAALVWVLAWFLWPRRTSRPDVPTRDEWNERLRRRRENEESDDEDET